MGKKRKRTKAQTKADALRSGRPPKPPEQRRGRKVMVYLTDAEYRRLEGEAAKLGRSLSDLLMRPWRKGS